MKTYNEKALETAKKLSNLPPEKRVKYSQVTAAVSGAGILLGTIGTIHKSGPLSYGIIGCGAVGLLTSIINIKK
ncbi:hypothetical protein LEQ06_00360 [Paraclostridium sp. AKS46]|nr:hypothetical protein [Paraclostridium sp. AKS46]